MSKTIKIFIVLCAVVGLAFAIIKLNKSNTDNEIIIQPASDNKSTEQEKFESGEVSPMSIEALRKREYLGGDFIIEKILGNGTNYRQFIASYKADGLKIYGLLTVPLAPKPENGYPAVIFVHGYISPKQYSTTGNYPTYQATLARSGVVTFKPDLRGHGQSEGEANGAHFSENNVVDVLSAIAYMKQHQDIDPKRIGYWGHSNGGETGLRSLVVSQEIKAAVFWAGVVGSFQDELETYDISFMRNHDNPLVEKYGLPSQNPGFWGKIDPYSYLSDISAPIQLHHGTSDDSVPVELSLHLKAELEKLGKPVEYFEYAGDDHNISKNVNTAWQRSIKFFQERL